MIKTLKKCGAWALSVIALLFAFVPEKCFSKSILFANTSEEVTIVLNRFCVFAIVFVLTVIVYALWLKFRTNITIKGYNYSINVEHGDLFEMSNCKKVIQFDECFITHVGDAPADIKPNSVCGQFLQKHPIQDTQMQQLINTAQVKPAKSKSKYQNRTRYESGKLVPYYDGDDHYLLMSFAKLSEIGNGEMTRDEYLDCLSLLWKEIDRHYGQKDVYITVLGAGITRMGDESLTQQKLLDIMIASYRLSSHKIKFPSQLHIVCKRSDGFSINRIGESI